MIIESKDAAQYTDHGSAAEHCGICDHWRSTGTGDRGACRIVSGRILAAGWCRHFIHVSEAAE
jgi:High potential iron-sulfur protein